MYNINKEHYKHNFISKEHYKNFDNPDKVIAYLKNWDKSNGYNTFVSWGAVRSRVIGKFLRDELDIKELPIMEKQLELVYNNFYDFKNWLNEKYRTKELMSY